MMLGDYANVLNEPRNTESSVFLAIAHRELGGSTEKALQVLDEVGLSKEDKEKVLDLNARRFFGLNERVESKSKQPAFA